MRDAVTTFRGLEDAAKTIPGLKQQLADAQKAASDAQAAQKTAEDALAKAQANAIPEADVADGNIVLDQLATQPATQPAQGGSGDVAPIDENA
jgi:type II secretory pathway component PulM